ncbi:lymphotoxin-alpha [Amia ocellicauda]|uniref:lymphotoxin-alpha n=1 Tax=Amia ocellicauda TaxID=2972642 RepID=UPI0034644C7F
MLSENRAELSWLSNVDQAFLHSDMALVANNTELLVPKDGLYFLYTQATFQSPASSSTSLAQRGRPCRGEDGNPLFLSLKVEQYSLSLPDRLLPILSASRSLCLPMGHDGGDSRFKFWTVPLYQGALVRLSQGDRLRVKMDPMKLLDDHTSYFGAFAVSVTK